MKAMTSKDFLDLLAIDLFGWNGDPTCCRRCNGPKGEFKDEPSHYEWERMGWCQKCQDGFFEEDE